jgi:hypothetical protein
MRRASFAAIIAVCSLLTMFGSRPADAEDDFYSGKTIQMLIGFSAGGGYDLYGRTLARYLGHHIPGNPQIVPQNMPGAGSLKLVNYLYNVAPKDGTAIGIFAPGIIAEPLLGHGDGAQFDATKFGWLGSVSQEVSVCAFMASTGIASLKDMQNKPIVIGASGGGAESDVFATVFRNMFHMPIRIVTGYPGGTEITLAMQRHAPHRVLRNQTVDAWEAAGRPPSGKRPGEGEVIASSRSSGPIVRYQSYTPGADAEGDIDALSLWAAQSVGLVSKLESAGDIVREIADEARLILQRLGQ